MESKLALPVGISNFREIRESDYFYVDKTSIIEELLDTGAKATLVTRPRRFGKTLTMTMIRDFFDITQESKEIFNGLSIMDSQYVSKINSTPVIYLSFKGCKGDIGDVLSCAYSTLLGMLDHAYAFRDKIKNVLDLEKLVRTKTILSDYDYSKKAQLAECILLLSKIYHQYYGKKAVILIDEYDTPMISAYERGYYDDIKYFFARLYGNALKDNPYLQFAVMTGTHRVLFSGPNNLSVCTIMTEQYQQYFGLTSEETQKLLTYYNLELTTEVKQMYNGYLFGSTSIYNPWSIINYAKKRKLVPYWVNTTSNEMLVQAMLVADKSVKEDLEQLFSVGRVGVAMDLRISFSEINRSAILWGLFLNSGYLAVTDESEANAFQTEVRIPNDEVMASFRKLIIRYADLSGETSLLNIANSIKRCQSVSETIEQ